MEFNTKFVLLSCAECGCLFAVTKPYEEQLRENHDTFFCPNGDENWFPPDEDDDDDEDDEEEKTPDPTPDMSVDELEKAYS